MLYLFRAIWGGGGGGGGGVGESMWLNFFIQLRDVALEFYSLKMKIKYKMSSTS